MANKNNKKKERRKVVIEPRIRLGLSTIIALGIVIYLAIKNWRYSLIALGGFVVLFGLYFLIKFIVKKAKQSKYQKDIKNGKIDDYKNYIPEQDEEILAIGEEGEEIVANELEKFTKPAGKVFNNVIISDQYGNSTEIDHILVSTKGVFVIETKNYYGDIFGDEDAKDIVVINNGKEMKHYNPVMQNEKHVERLKKYVDLRLPVKPVVVFVQDNICKFNTNKAINLSSLSKFIKNSKTEASSYSAIKHDIAAIEEAISNNTVTKEEHVNNIYKNKELLGKKICPACGKKLVLKEDKEGKPFYGCEGFPDCRFKASVNAVEENDQ